MKKYWNNKKGAERLLVLYFYIHPPVISARCHPPSLRPQGSSQKSLVIKIFAVGHLKIVDFPALAKNDKLLPKSQKVLLCYDFSGTLGLVFTKKRCLFLTPKSFRYSLNFLGTPRLPQFNSKIPDFLLDVISIFVSPWRFSQNNIF